METTKKKNSMPLAWIVAGTAATIAGTFAWLYAVAVAFLSHVDVATLFVLVFGFHVAFFGVKCLAHADRALRMGAMERAFQEWKKGKGGDDAGKEG